MANGSWYITCKSDKRWNASGRGLVGGLVMPEAVKAKVEELKEQFGEVPDDAEWGYMKD